jgi:signal recognition particle receptor subunit beta
MVTFNHSVRQMTLKIVYYGPGLCGKTSNLQFIYNKISPKARGEMVSLNTESDRTLFFDLLPVDIGTIGGFKTKVQLYTVPGQVFYDSTRKLVLRGADGVVFVADSQEAMRDSNKESLKNLAINLREYGVDINEMPIVFQWNKRDLPNIMTVEEMERDLNPRGLPAMAAIATSTSKDNGVFDTLRLVTKLAVEDIKRLHFGEGGTTDKESKALEPPHKKAPLPAFPAAEPVPEPIPSPLPPVAKPSAFAGFGFQNPPSALAPVPVVLVDDAVGDRQGAPHGDPVAEVTAAPMPLDLDDLDAGTLSGIARKPAAEVAPATEPEPIVSVDAESAPKSGVVPVADGAFATAAPSEPALASAAVVESGAEPVPADFPADSAVDVESAVDAMFGRPVAETEPNASANASIASEEGTHSEPEVKANAGVTAETEPKVTAAPLAKPAPAAARPLIQPMKLAVPGFAFPKPGIGKPGVPGLPKFGFPGASKSAAEPAIPIELPADLPNEITIKVVIEDGDGMIVGEASIVRKSPSGGSTTRIPMELHRA